MAKYRYLPRIFRAWVAVDELGTVYLSVAMRLQPPPELQSVQWCDLPTECIEEALRRLPLPDVGLPAAACRGNAIAAATLGMEPHVQSVKAAAFW